MLGSLFGASGSSLTRSLGMSKAGAAGQDAIEGANFEAEMEITAAQLNKINRDKITKIQDTMAAERKARMDSNSKNSSQITF